MKRGRRLGRGGEVPREAAGALGMGWGGVVVGGWDAFSGGAATAEQQQA